MNAQGYTVGELADLAGVTVFTLRHYDQLGLLHPLRDAHSRYRHYGPKDVDRLQEILLFRRMGAPLSDIAPLLKGNRAARRAALAQQLEALRAEHEETDRLIATVERSIEALDGKAKMTDEEKFEGLRHTA